MTTLLRSKSPSRSPIGALIFNDVFFQIVGLADNEEKPGKRISEGNREYWLTGRGTSANRSLP